MDKPLFEIELASHNLCTGCRVCADVCPTNSISFTLSDDSIHAFPSINSITCVHCHRCEKVCVSLHPERIKKDEVYEEKYYLGYNINKEERFLSTSGGVGGALADFALNSGFHVVGAIFDKDWHLYHTVSKDKGVLPKIRGSKYLLSDMTGVYSKILSLVKSKEKVLFFGTPCQIQALLNIIPDVYKENVVTCGIICHGVNSPLVWNDFVSYLEHKYNSHLRTYNFRSKSKGWGKLWIDFSFDNGKVVSQPAEKNLFHIWFGKHYILRESCFHCLFRKKERYSDICIGDFWGIEKVRADIDYKDGISVVISSSIKGENFLSLCKDLHLEQVDGSLTPFVLKGYIQDKDVITINKEVERNSQFARQYNKYSFEEMSKIYHCPTLQDKLISSIKSRLKLQ